MFCGGIEGAGQVENGVRSLGIHWAYGPGPIGPTHLLGPMAVILLGLKKLVHFYF